MDLPHPSKSSIMIVDDQVENIQYLENLLGKFGFEILPAKDAEEVFRALETTLPDIILLDVIIPDTDGFEICRQIKQNPATRDIPVILMTDLSESIDKVTGIELGASDYINKPFNDQEVLTRLKNQFVMRQLHLQLEKTREALKKSAGMPPMELEKSYEQLKKELAEQKRMEQILKQARKMEAISTLSRGIAHDFNNILSIIIGYCELATLEPLPEDSAVESCLEKINDAAFRARELVQNLLTFCHETEQEKTRIKPAPLITYVIKSFEKTIPDNIEIIKELEEDTGTVLADPALIHQMLMNLLRNAGQAMHEKGGRISIRLQQTTLDAEQTAELPNLIPGPYVSITICDTGPGMDPEILDRIFDPYFTTREPGEGKGLGMSVALGIATGLGGTIRVESHIGKGSSFEILLPCKLTRQTTAQAAPDSIMPTGSGTVLFIDDEESLVDFGTAVLEKSGYTVQGFTSSVEALETIQKDPGKFDLIITDHIMPKLHGLDLARMINELREDLPILLCTGTKSDELTEHARTVGVVNVIQKPVPMKKLINAINAILMKE